MGLYTFLCEETEDISSQVFSDIYYFEYVLFYVNYSRNITT